MENSPPNRMRLMFAVAGAVLAVSTAAILIKFAQQDVPSLTIAALRLVFASLTLAPLAARRRAELNGMARRELGFALLAGLFLALHFATWISSLAFTSVASSVVLVTTTPLWVALVSPFALKEPLKREAVFGLALALVGGIIVGLGDACGGWDKLVCPPWGEFFMLKGQALFGNFLALVGAWMAAGYLLIGRRLRAKLSLTTYTFVVYGAAALGLAAAMFAAGQSPFGYSPLAYLWLLALALIPQLLGHSTLNWALRYLPASFVSIALLGEPVGSTVLAYFLLGETPTPLKLVGMGLILTGIYAASIEG